MSAERLSSRAIIGRFYTSVSSLTGNAMGLRLGAVFNSDQRSEEYAWLGATPQLSEWKGGRIVDYLRDNGLVIENVHYQATIGFKTKDLSRDKSGQTLLRVDELALRANTHWNKLASELIVAGENTACYDGEYFFDTDHEEGKSGVQSNDIQIDISSLPASVHGSPAAPSVEEAAQVILKIITTILGFKDDQGEPMNDDAMKFEIVVPTPLFSAFSNAAAMAVFPNGGSNPVAASRFEVTVTMDPRSPWTTKVAGFRTDGIAAKPFIFQEEGGISTKYLGEGSDLEFEKDEHRFGVDAWRGAGYGLWQHACLATMT